MLTVEYYWHTPSVQETLIAIYEMTGDGTPGLCDLEPWDWEIPPSASRLEKEMMTQLMALLTSDPSAFMSSAYNSGSPYKAWTEQLVQDQASWKGSFVRTVVSHGCEV